MGEHNQRMFAGNAWFNVTLHLFPVNTQRPQEDLFITYVEKHARIEVLFPDGEVDANEYALRTRALRNEIFQINVVMDDEPVVMPFTNTTKFALLSNQNANTT